MRHTTRGVPRGVLALASAVAFIEAALFSVLAPLLPQFEQDFDLTGTEAGVLVASYAAGAFVAAFPSIAVARRTGVKATVVSAFVILALATLALGVADSLPWAMTARFLQGVGSALALTGAIAWLTTVTAPSLRAGAIGLAFSAAFVGALLGPVLGAAAASLGVATVFTALAVAVAALAAATLGLTSPTRSVMGKTPPLAQLFHDHAARIGFWLILVAGMYLGVVGVLVPLQLDRLGFDAVAIGTVFAIAAVIQTFASPRFGRLADTHGRELPIRIALTTATGAFFLLLFDSHTWLYAPVAVVAIISLGMLWTPAMALLADAAERRGFEMSTAAGMMNVAWAPGFAVGGIVAGWLAQTVGSTVPYALMGAICLGTLLLVRAPRSAVEPTN